MDCYMDYEYHGVGLLLLLPSETIDKILEYVFAGEPTPGRHRRTTLTKTCRSLNILSERHLFRHINITGLEPANATIRLFGLARAFTSNPSRACLVRSFRSQSLHEQLPFRHPIIPWLGRMENLTELKLGATSDSRDLQTLQNFFLAAGTEPPSNIPLTNLVKCEIGDWDKHFKTNDVRQQWSFREGLSIFRHPRLSYITLNGVFAVDESADFIKELAKLEKTSNVKHLTLYNARLSLSMVNHILKLPRQLESFKLDWCLASTIAIPLRVGYELKSPWIRALRACYQSLEELSLVPVSVNEMDFVFPERYPSLSRFKSLKRLQLDSGFFDGLPRTGRLTYTEILKLMPKTLVVLELAEYRINAPNDLGIFYSFYRARPLISLVELLVYRNFSRNYLPSFKRLVLELIWDKETNKYWPPRVFAKRLKKHGIELVVLIRGWMMWGRGLYMRLKFSDMYDEDTQVVFGSTFGASAQPIFRVDHLTKGDVTVEDSAFRLSIQASWDSISWADSNVVMRKDHLLAFLGFFSIHQGQKYWI